MFITGHNLLLIMSDKKKDDKKEDDSFSQRLADGATAAAVVGAVGLAAYGMYKLFGSLDESSRKSPQEDVHSSISALPYVTTRGQLARESRKGEYDSLADNYNTVTIDSIICFCMPKQADSKILIRTDDDKMKP